MLPAQCAGGVAAGRGTWLSYAARVSGPILDRLDLQIEVTALTSEELMAALPPDVSISGARTPYQPNVDGSLLPAAPLDAIRNGQHNRVPTVIGANTDETAQEVPLTFTEAQYQAYLAIAIPDEAARAQVADLYSSAIFGTARRAYIALTSDIKFICPSRTIARALAGAQSEPVYRYFFTEVPDAPASAAYGGFHGLELLYVFGTLDVRGYAPTALERALSSGMQRYWGSLAASGIPVAAGAATWTRYNAAVARLAEEIKQIAERVSEMQTILYKTKR